MTYEERTRMIGTWLVKVLRRYTPPTGMDDDTLREEMNYIVQDINQHIPSQFDNVDIEQVLPKIDGHVRATHGARAWPSIKIFISSTKDAVQEYSKAITVPKVTVSYGADKSDIIIAKRIIAGEGIPDYMLDPNSITRQRLIDSGLVSESDLSKYLAPVNK